MALAMLLLFPPSKCSISDYHITHTICCWGFWAIFYAACVIIVGMFFFCYKCKETTSKIVETSIWAWFPWLNWLIFAWEFKRGFEIFRECMFWTLYEWTMNLAIFYVACLIFIGISCYKCKETTPKIVQTSIWTWFLWLNWLINIFLGIVGYPRRDLRFFEDACFGHCMNKLWTFQSDENRCTQKSTLSSHEWRLYNLGENLDEVVLVARLKLFEVPWVMQLFLNLNFTQVSNGLLLRWEYNIVRILHQWKYDVWRPSEKQLTKRPTTTHICLNYLQECTIKVIYKSNFAIFIVVSFCNISSTLLVS